MEMLAIDSRLEEAYQVEAGNAEPWELELLKWQ
jgi:hypothetical protein